MNKIAKILSVVLSATIALSVAVVMIVSAVAAGTPSFSLNLASEDDKSVTVAVKLDKGGFNSLDLTVSAGSKLGACTDATESDDYLMYLMKGIKEVKGVGSSAINADTGKLSTAVTVAYDKAGTDVALFTFEKKTADKVTNEDLTLVVTSCKVDDKDVTPEVINNLPVAAEAPAEDITEAPAEDITEAPAEDITEAPAEDITEAPAEDVTEAPAEDVTEAPAEDVTEAPAEEDTTAAPAADDAPVAPAADGDAAPAADTAVVNPDTGDSISATAAVISLLAISTAAAVALRKKED